MANQEISTSSEKIMDCLYKDLVVFMCLFSIIFRFWITSCDFSDYRVLRKTGARESIRRRNLDEKGDPIEIKCLQNSDFQRLVSLFA